MRRFTAKGYKIYGASVDGIKANAAFAAKFSFSFPLLCDPQKSLTRAFDACKDANCTKPDRITVVVDGAGKIERYLKPFDARTGPQALLDSL